MWGWPPYGTGYAALVFASSNHVMGGYKDAPLSTGLQPGGLTTDLPPSPGTKWHDGTTFQNSTRLATAKLMGERLVTGLGLQSEGALTGVSVRIGWAQPGENLCPHHESRGVGHRWHAGGEGREVAA